MANNWYFRQLLTPAETKALFAHLDSLAQRIGGLERMLAEARLEGEGVSQQSSTTQVRGKKATAHQTSKPGKKELLEEYGLLSEALKPARPTNSTDGEAHSISLNQMAALAADAVALYELGVAIGSPIRIKLRGSSLKGGKKRPKRRQADTHLAS